MIVVSLAKRVGLTAREAWWSAALVASMPAVYAGAHTGFVDALYAAFVLAAARIAFDAHSPSEFAALGIFCGFAMGTKYTGVLAVPILLFVALAFWNQEPRGQWRKQFAGAGLAAAVALLVAAPFYMRNWILLGSPIYPPPPLLARIFHVKYLSTDAIQSLYVYFQNRGRGLGRGFAAYILLPFRLTYHTSNFHGAGGIGLAGLAFAPFALIAARRDRFLAALALMGFLLTTVWFLTQQESRFLIHAYALAAIFAVTGWRYVQLQRARLLSFLSCTVVATSILYGLFMIASSRKDDLRAAISPTFAQRIRCKRVPFVESFDFLNSDPSVQRVLILDRSVPPFYCNKPYLKPVGQWGELVLPDAPDSTHILGRLGEFQVSHVLDVSSEVSSFRIPANAPNLTPVFAAPNQRVYRVN
jgi:4-amino-4-deoxy-L-arabinose transferase-like glycosyltransferase